MSRSHDPTHALRSRAACLLITFVATTGVACGTESAERGEPAEERIALFDDLGSLHRSITTASPEAQRYFDQGLRMTYGFNHAEAIRSYEAALAIDPACAMCWWGIAFALGPNINAPMDSAVTSAAQHAVTQAQGLAANAGEVEQAMIAALAKRYIGAVDHNRAALDSAWVAAAAEVSMRFPDDDDAAVLFADALMNLAPWNYWEPGPQPRPGTETIVGTLERVITRHPDHVGACHLYIHAVEAAYPERAVPCADRLPSLMPGAGHIVHMPAHIYVRVGRWADAITTNEHATHADAQHIEDMAPDGIYRLGYVPHNFHFIWFGANMAGNSARSIQAASDVAMRVDTSLMRAPGLSAIQHYLMTPLFAQVRFGRWDDILAAPAPPADLPYPTGVWHYARALAFTAKDQLEQAGAELQALEALLPDPWLESELIWNINTPKSVLETARHVVAGEIAARRGDLDGAIRHLRAGVATEDAMLYDEPPTWHLPVRHNLGAVLLQAGRAGEAETVYREDLVRNPENGWSLYGLAASLRAQSRTAEAGEVTARFRAAWSIADVDIVSSRYQRESS
ncbi:MAG: hypothetical protein L0271_26005 [Gemmatimonadetes bacterium]|nr:hypothetical protein [Gemmatimonadota bacterium]